MRVTPEPTWVPITETPNNDCSVILETGGNSTRKLEANPDVAGIGVRTPHQKPVQVDQLNTNRGLGSNIFHSECLCLFSDYYGSVCFRTVT